MDILTLLKQAARNKSSIRLLNIYKGLPISYDTSIIAVGFSEIQVPGSKSHIACLFHQGESFIQSDDIPYILRSTVKSLNLAQDYAVLTNFEVAQPTIGKREQIRVEPDDPLVVSIQFKGAAYEFLAPLADISASGISVFFEDFLFPSRLAQPGNEFAMSITIPDFVARKMKKVPPRTNIDVRKTTAPLRATPTPSGQDGQVVIKANGKVIAVRQEPELNRYRMSASILFKDLSRMVILQYISHRQAEIIKDLRILSEELYNHKKTDR